jgi:hypothetical protein
LTDLSATNSGLSQNTTPEISRGNGKTTATITNQSRVGVGTEYLPEYKTDSNPFEPQSPTFAIAITGFVFMTFNFGVITLVLFEVTMHSNDI